jgi:acetyl esterase/lipase
MLQTAKNVVSRTTMRILWALGLVLIAGGLIYHFAAFRLFNALVPKDAGVKRVAAGISYGTDPRLTYDLYRAETPGTLPLLVFVYGGSWDSGEKELYEFAAKAFAAKGYLVAVPDYRLVPQHVYPVFVEDTANAIAHVQKTAAKYEGDGTRTFLVGHSAGAYNLAQAALNKKFSGLFEKPKAIATLAGPFDFLPLDSPKSVAAFSYMKNLAETQPVNHVDGAPPFLILHGRADTTVRLKNATSLHDALKKSGNVTELKIYEDATHVSIMLSIAKPLRNRLPVLEDVTTFFERYE